MGSIPSIPFGAKVRVSAKYRRGTHYTQTEGQRKTWNRWEFGTPREGLYIGCRTLSNGKRWWEDEVGYLYDPKEYFQALLIVFSERTKPVLVPVDAVELT